MFKRFISMLLCICMAVSVATPVLAEASIATIYSGNYGDGFEWTFDISTGELMISGSGILPNLSDNNLIPWYVHKNSIKSITVEQGITSIKAESFGEIGVGYYYLKNINLPNTLIDIDNEVFFVLSSLESINVISGGCFYSVDGVLYKEIEGNNMLYFYPMNKSNLEYSIPNGVNILATRCFIGNNNLAVLNIPDTLSESAVHTNSFTELLRFYNLQQVNVNESHKSYCSIDGVLYNKNLTKLIFYPNGRKDKSFIIPEGVTSATKKLLYSMKYIEELYIPSTLSVFDDGCIISTDISLKNIIVDTNNQYYSSKDGVLYNKQQNEIIRYPANKEISSYNIDNNVVAIGTDAFAGARNLVELYIPNSVKVIHNGAFISCCYSSIYFFGSVPELEYNQYSTTFSTINNTNFTIYYPDGNTSGWTSPTWNAPDGSTYNTAPFNPDELKLPVNLTITPGTQTTQTKISWDVTSNMVRYELKYTDNATGLIYNGGSGTLTGINTLSVTIPQNPGIYTVTLNIEYTDGEILTAATETYSVDYELNVVKGKKYTQSTIKKLGYDHIPNDININNLPYFDFKTEDTGVFHIVTDSSEYDVEFNYSFQWRNITLTPISTDISFNGASYIRLEVDNTGSLILTSYDTSGDIGLSYNGDKFTLKASSITTTFDTTEINLQEGGVLFIDGIVSTTSELGLNNIQVNITDANTGIGIKLFRAENIGEKEYLLTTILPIETGKILSGFDSLGYPQNLNLVAGTSWNIQIFATDMENNSIGDNIIKRVNIVGAPINNLNGNVYYQTSNSDKFDSELGIPYVSFRDNNYGDFVLTDTEKNMVAYETFIYAITGNKVTLVSINDNDPIGLAKEIVMRIEDDKLIIEKITCNDANNTVILGCTGLNDVFQKQLPPTVTGLQNSYTVTQGQSLPLSFTVMAAEGKNLKVINFKKNGSVDSVYRVENIGANSHTVNCTIPADMLSVVGTHTFVLYASADNFTKTQNDLAVVNVIVNEKQLPSNGRITKDSPCTYENVFKAMCQILEDKNDGYNEYAKYEWEIDCPKKKGWYTDEFLLLVMATAWTESNWNHYESDGSVKVHGDSNDTGIMQLNTVDTVTKDWLIQAITEDWYYNLEYGMGSLWTAYNESKNEYKNYDNGKYNNSDDIARGSYCRYNAGPGFSYDTKKYYYWNNSEKTEYGKKETNYGKVSSVHRFHFTDDARDTNFYRNYSIIKQWFNGNDGGATSGLYKAYEVFCEFYGNIHQPETPIVIVPPTIEQTNVSIAVKSSFNKSIVNEGETVIISGTVTSIGAPLDKITIQWYQGSRNVTEIDVPDNVYTYNFISEVDTSKYGAGVYRVYGAVTGITHSYDEIMLTIIPNDDTYDGQYFSMKVDGIIENDNIYTITDDSKISIDYGVDVSSGGIYLKRNGVIVGNNIWSYNNVGNILEYKIDISDYENGLYDIESYANSHGELNNLSGKAYEKIRIVHIPQIDVNGKIVDENKIIKCNVDNDIEYSCDFENNNISQCIIRWAGGTVGIITKTNKSVRILYNDIADIPLNTEFTTYCDVYYDDGTMYTIAIKLILYKSNIDNAEIRKNIEVIESYYDRSINVLNKYLLDETISNDEYIYRKNTLENAFKMATFVWTTDTTFRYRGSTNDDIDTNGVKYDTYDENVIYYGVPYTQYNRKYNEESVKGNIAGQFIDNDSDGVYKIVLNPNIVDKHNTNATKYFGNDCSSFVGQCIDGTTPGTSTITSYWEKNSNKYAVRPGDVLCARKGQAGHAVIFLYWEKSGNDYHAICIEQGTGELCVYDTFGGTRTVCVSKYTKESLKKLNGYNVYNNIYKSEEVSCDISTIYFYNGDKIENTIVDDNAKRNFNW